MNDEIATVTLYSTSDLALAAVLNLYYKLNDINNDNPKKVLFIFEKDRNFDLIIERYWRSDLKVDPHAYFNSIKLLKNRIYNS